MHLQGGASPACEAERAHVPTFRGRWPLATAPGRVKGASYEIDVMANLRRNLSGSSVNVPLSAGVRFKRSWWAREPGAHPMGERQMGKDKPLGYSFRP